MAELRTSPGASNFSSNVGRRGQIQAIEADMMIAFAFVCGALAMLISILILVRVTS